MTAALEIRAVLFALVAVQVATAVGGIAAVDRVAGSDTDAARAVADAGAWGLVLLALVGLALAGAGLRRLRRTLVAPLEELAAVLEARSRGSRHRRCARFPGTALTGVLEAVDALLDADASARERGPSDAGCHRARIALAGLLDRAGEPLLIWDPGEAAGGGRLVAASRAAHDRLGDDDAALEAIRQGSVEPEARLASSGSGAGDGPPLLLYRLGPREG